MGYITLHQRNARDFARLPPEQQIGWIIILVLASAILLLISWGLNRYDFKSVQKTCLPGEEVQDVGSSQFARYQCVIAQPPDPGTPHE